MELTIEQSCPSCGAAIVLHEDDRLIHCEFCDVPNFRVRQKLPRYVLPFRLPRHVAEENLLYVPYLRFKGCIYSIQGIDVLHRLIDTTRVGCAFSTVPASLGLRPQAMKVAPVTERLQGGFVRQSVKAKKIFAEAVKIARLFTEDRTRDVHHRAFIGETISRVYLPVYHHDGMLYDGVTQQQLGPDTGIDELSGDVLPFMSEWEPRFISTLCPECGDDMRGSRETLVMICPGCDSQWIEENGRFHKLHYLVVPPKSEDVRFLPFWRIEPKDESGQLTTLADFLAVTNQPVIIRQHHRKQQMRFYMPAFKMNPAIFLQAARMLTISQNGLAQPQQGTVSWAKANVYPVTLPHGEAVEAMKTVLAASAVSGRRVIELLPSLQFQSYRKELVYLPFHDAGHDYIEHHTGVSISRAALRFGRKM